MGMVNQKKIYFASDVHLGFPSNTLGLHREKLFVNWLTSIEHDAEMLFLVGDIFDFWYEYKKVVPRGFVRTLGKLAQMADAGIKIHFFTGNHDVWAFDYLKTEVGLNLHYGPLETTLYNKTFYIAHGDGLGPGDISYKLLKVAFTSRFLQWCFSRLHPNFAFALGHAWSRKSRYAKGIEASFNSLNNELLYLHSHKILEQKHFDFFVYGHRHLALNEPVGNKSRFIILGDWLFNFTYGVFNGNTFEIKHVKAR
jgi:UDP-2,3-diacylglucosamine hydrolase